MATQLGDCSWKEVEGVEQIDAHLADIDKEADCSSLVGSILEIHSLDREAVAQQNDAEIETSHQSHQRRWEFVWYSPAHYRL